MLHQSGEAKAKNKTLPVWDIGIHSDNQASTMQKLNENAGQNASSAVGYVYDIFQESCRV